MPGNSQETRAQYWKVNALRSFCVLLTVIVVILVADHLDTFMSVVGAVFGMSNVLVLPGLAHLKLVSKTKKEIYFDYFVIGFGCFMMVFTPTTILLS